MKLKSLVILLAVSVLLTSCAFGYGGLRNANKEKLSTLEIGMSKNEVLGIMGTSGFGTIRQPYKRETFESDGEVYEVYYFYTDFIQPYQPYDTGMTPFIFKGGEYKGNSMGMIKVH